MAKSFDNIGIARRFFSIYKGKKLRELSDMFGASTGSISDWKGAKKPIPWDVLNAAVKFSGKSWDWLLEGRGPVQAGNMGPDPNVLLVGQWQKNGVMRKVHIQIYEDD